MRTLGWAIGCAVVGFLLGGIGPRRDLTALKERYDQLETRFTSSRQKNAVAGEIFAMMPRLAAMPKGQTRALNLPMGVTGNGAQAAGAEGVDPKAAAPGQQLPNVVGGTTNSIYGQAGAGSAGYAGGQGGAAVAANANDAEGAAGNGQPGADPRSATQPLTVEKFDELANTQSMRIAAARNALVEQGGLQPQEMAAVDKTLETMNQKLSDYSYELADLSKQPDVPPAELLDVSHRISGALLDGQTGLDGIVGKERLTQLDPATADVSSYIDIGKLKGAAEQILPKDALEAAERAQTRKSASASAAAK